MTSKRVLGWDWRSSPIFFSTASPTEASLAPLARDTEKATTGSPLKRAKVRGSAELSVSIAISSSLTRRPPGSMTFVAAAGEIDARRAELPVYLRGRDAEREQPVGLQRHADLAVDAADPIDATDAAHALELAGDDVVDEPGQLFGRQRRVRGRVGHNRQAGDLDPLHDRLVDGARQVLPDLGDRVLDVVDGAVLVGLEAELDRRRRQPFRDRRDDVLDAVDPGDRVLDALRDLVLQLGGRRARLRHGDRDDRNVDVREARDRQLAKAEDPEDQKDDEQDDRRDRLPDRPGGDVEAHQRVSAVVATVRFGIAASTARTTSPSRRKLPARAAIASPALSPSVTSTNPSALRPVATRRSSTLSPTTASTVAPSAP